ncbi:MAG: type II toxin-antitoxin system prevent-host-death family antitoxin [Sulfurimonas sp.]|uniref:type II toxin-antitoxin system prevent-host-death family antitoxin n=1 Tax=Sulfurimonas sp. TaxID=2022749 RepID=UPI00260FD62F|nr:type II toxin-antitoxin system prevent-host-death family antitoxin [Sulfurimonas sp.]MDD2652650.1 type II toxin-antitoxin system prevent-host-death family antitoxin [Sulfurimonas sp.]MDD3450817.1 type II toxin-antitoxin system prevent-host-death family antitoxin [Sulfurimonas sp.]
MANEVKTKGVSLFDSLLQKAEEIIINVRGKNKFVVVDIERYKELRALELDRAYQDAMNDIKEGRYKVLSAKEHLEEFFKELEHEIQN